MNLIRFMLPNFRKERSHSLFSPTPDNPNITNGEERLNQYPDKTFLGEQGSYAYHLIFMLKRDELSELQALIASLFGDQTHHGETVLRNKDQESMVIAYREEFGGIIVEAATNSIPIIRDLDSHFPAPPPPWIAFPEMEPIEAEMGKQGSLEYWWSRIWLPFWSTRTPIEKEQYLLDNGATAEWREVLP